jgi:hypothetical protein
MKRFVLPLVAVFACHARNDRAPSLELGPDLAEVGFGEAFEIDARADAGDVTWTQVSGPKLLDVVATPRRFSARMPPLAAEPPNELPWGIVPFSPRTRGEAIIEAEWRSARGGASVRRSVRVAAAARSRGLPNVPLGQRLYLGGAGWHLSAGPANTGAQVRDLHGASTFTPDRDGVFTLTDGAGKVLRVQAGRYDETPLDCGRSSCHEDLSAATQRSPMTMSLARLFARPATTTDPRACALACHATGEPGTHDGGFLDVAADLGLSAPLDDVAGVADLPRPLRRLGGVGCLACHGPSALPESAARWSILRSDVCAYCHDAPPRYGHVAGWRASAMARADRDPEARADAGCVACHTTWGFLAQTRSSSIDRAEPRRPPEEAGALGIACAACHDTHAEGADANAPHGLLRSMKLPDLFERVPDEARRRSGACLACHTPAASDLARASAAAIWAGRGGVDPDTGAALVGPAPHLAVPGGCVGCHAVGPAGIEAGANHAFAADKGRCPTCHRALPAPSLEADVRDLWKRLVELGVVELPRETAPSRPAHAAAKIRPGARAPLRRAAFDLSLLLEDPAATAHNAPYAQQLLDASKRALARP